MQVSAAYPGGRPPGNPRATAGHGIGLFQNVPHETGDLANICFLQINPGDNPPRDMHMVLLHGPAVITGCPISGCTCCHHNI